MSPADARFIGPRERLLFLKGTAFGDLPPDDLAAMANNLRERRFRPSDRLLEAGSPVESVYIIAEGRVSLRHEGHVYRVLEAPGSVGYLAALAGAPEGVEAVAESDVVALEQSVERVIDGLEENFGLLEGTLRALAGEVATLQRTLELKGQLNREPPRTTPYPARELDLVQRMMLLRSSGPYTGTSLDALVDVARRSTEVRLAAGQSLWRTGDPSSYGVHIIHGVVACVGDDGRRHFRMGPRSVLGYLEAYSGQPRTYDATAETDVVALRGDVESVIDAMEDNFPLAVSFIAFLAKEVIRLARKLAEQEPPLGPHVP